MSEYIGAEFTGERVIPELVDADLLNEHLARYRFARHFAGGLRHPARILDAGCGSGYGTAELAGETAGVVGMDIAAEAIRHATQRYGSAGVRFLQGACESLPFRDAAFDLMAAFEVIEHLDRWRELLAEANRVLKPSGVLLVSTPNRDYYAESRGAAGPNPFHRHEFDYEEFRDSLRAVFPHVRIWTQNHAEAIVFSPEQPTASVLNASGSKDASAANDPAGAHFYLAACSQSPLAENAVFTWVPSSANVLRERERHIAKLTGELAQKDEWLRQSVVAHNDLQRKHESLVTELERRNNWALELNGELAIRNVRIGELQEEVAARLSWIDEMEAGVRDKDSQLERARIEIERLNAELNELRQQAVAEIGRLRAKSAEFEGALTEQTIHAGRLTAKIEGLRAESAEFEDALTKQRLHTGRLVAQLTAEIEVYRGELQHIESSRWFRAGAKLGLGPRPRDGR